MIRKLDKIIEIQKMLLDMETPPQAFHKCLSRECKNKTVNEYCKKCYKAILLAKSKNKTYRKLVYKLDNSSKKLAVNIKNTERKKAEKIYRENIKNRAIERIGIVNKVVFKNPSKYGIEII